LIGRVLTKGKRTGLKGMDGAFTNDSSPLLLVNAMPNQEGDGIILQLREISGETYQLDPVKLINFKKTVIGYEVNALGDKMGSGTGKIIFKPYSVHFLEIKWKKS